MFRRDDEDSAERGEDDEFDQHQNDKTGKSATALEVGDDEDDDEASYDSTEETENKEPVKPIPGRRRERDAAFEAYDDDDSAEGGEDDECDQSPSSFKNTGKNFFTQPRSTGAMPASKERHVILRDAVIALMNEHPSKNKHERDVIIMLRTKLNEETVTHQGMVTAIYGAHNKLKDNRSKNRVSYFDDALERFIKSQEVDWIKQRINIPERLTAGRAVDGPARKI